MNIKSFRKIIWDYYKKNKRDFPWRPPSLVLRKDSETLDPYKILISEVMLQQTQTYRVQPKYEAWIKEFPGFEHLAKAPFSKVLKFWSGLGYNRRALYLHTTAKMVVAEHKGKLPMDPSVLETFPGIGKNTAGSVYVFSTNKPHVFIETNTRRVFIHHFFSHLGHPELDSGSPKGDSGSKSGMTASVDDKDILPLIEQTLPKRNPREWYYALMDYGNYLAKQIENPNRKSKHYTKQSVFEGSLRQIRGKILKILLEKKFVQINHLNEVIRANPLLVKEALRQLEKEGFIITEYKKIRINLTGGSPKLKHSA